MGNENPGTIAVYRSVSRGGSSGPFGEQRLAMRERSATGIANSMGLHIRIYPYLVVLLIQLCFLAWTSYARSDRFVVMDGTVISTDNDGSRKRLDVHKRCLDLWVSPDESVIAFVGVDKTRMPDEAPRAGTEQPMIERSTIYLASQLDHFVPKAVVARSFEIDGRNWSVLREPSISPDRQTLFFKIPISMTTSRVMSLSLSSNQYRSVANATGYCVLWGGRYSGLLLLQQRHVRGDLPAGSLDIAYRCVRVGKAGKSDSVSEDCPDFSSFADQWSREHAASCNIPSP